jgi:hypothetical protein
MKISSDPVTDPRREAWALHLKDVFDMLEIPPGTETDHLVSSIAMYCRHHPPGGLTTTELRLLIARAFCAVGDRPAAKRVLESMEPHRRHSARWLEILSELHHFPELLPFFSRGVIRPADWAGARLDRMWTLDFGRLALSDAERHEMMLCRSVRMLVEAMAACWDATGGEGILGLKNLAVMDIPGSRDGHPAPASADGWLDYINDLFTRQQAERNWHATPSLLNLDL